MFDPRPLHLLSYGSLLGIQVYQSFVAGIVAYRSLPRPQFSTLQSSIFPIYFGLQTALPIVVALTSAQGRQTHSLSGALTPDTSTQVLLPLGVACLSGLANLCVLGPLTTKIMKERKHQETRDGKRYYDPPPHSKEMVALNKRFGRLHGMSSLVNLISIIATVYYGAVLSKRLE